MYGKDCDTDSSRGSDSDDEEFDQGYTIVKINGKTHVYTAEAGPSVVHIPGMRNLQIGDGKIKVINGTTRSHHRRHSPHERHRQSPPRRQPSKLTDSTAKVSRSDLNFVCKNIGKQWKQLGNILGLSRGQIGAIEVDFHVEGVYEMAYQTLLKWKRQNGDLVTVQELAHALDAIGMTEVAEELPVG